MVTVIVHMVIKGKHIPMMVAWGGNTKINSLTWLTWLVRIVPFFLLNAEQMSNWLGLEHQPVTGEVTKDFRTVQIW